MDNMQILLPELVSEAGIQYLENFGYTVKHGRGVDRDVLMEDLRDCVGVIVRKAVIDEAIMQSAPQLRVIAKHGAGYDNIDIPAARRLGIRVVHTPIANSCSVAEHTITLMLACAKRLTGIVEHYRQINSKFKNNLLVNEIHGKTLGLIGLGHIGSLVASAAKNGLGMRVIAYDPFVAPEAANPDAQLIDDLQALLAQADYISLHMPETEHTRRFIGEKELRQMKPTAVLINTSRGTLVDEAALIRALTDGVIGGAGLDVTDPEPAAASNPMFHMDNVVLTPHYAASTKEAMDRMAVSAAEGIVDVCKGSEPKWVLV